jgi:hypothetical protein
MIGREPRPLTTGTKNVGPAVPALLSFIGGPRSAASQPVHCNPAAHFIYFFFFFFAAMITSVYTRRRKTRRLSAPYNTHFANEWKLNKRTMRSVSPRFDLPAKWGIERPRISTSAAAAPGLEEGLPRIPVGNLDDSGTMGELLHQRVSHCPIRRVEIGVPFVQEIDRGIGMVDDLLQRPQLTLA